MSNMIKKFIFKEPQGDGEFVEIEISDEGKNSEKVHVTVDGQGEYISFSLSFETAKELSAVLQGLVGTVPVQPLKPHQLPRGADKWQEPYRSHVHEQDDIGIVNLAEKSIKSPMEVLNSYLNNG